MNFENGTKNWDNFSMEGNMGQGCCGGMQSAQQMPMMPVYECPEERVCHRYICYDVPHE